MRPTRHPCLQRGMQRDARIKRVTQSHRVTEKLMPYEKKRKPHTLAQSHLQHTVWLPSPLQVDCSQLLWLFLVQRTHCHACPCFQWSSWLSPVRHMPELLLWAPSFPTCKVQIEHGVCVAHTQVVAEVPIHALHSVWVKPSKQTGCILGILKITHDNRGPVRV